MPVEIREAVKPEEREAVYRLRYDIYVDEMGRFQEFADASRRRIEEPWDATAHLFAAWSDGEIVGTLRYNACRDGPAEYEDRFELERFAPLYPAHVSMASKFLVRPAFRSSGVAIGLLGAAYRFGRSRGDRLTFIDCRPHLLRMYQLLGCRTYRSNIELPSSGTVTPMVQIVDDNEYFARIRSPMLRYAREFPGSTDTRDFFASRFPEYASLIPQFALSEDDAYAAIVESLAGEPAKQIPLFGAMSQDELTSIAKIFDILDYDADQWVFRQGDHSAGMFVILDGQVEAVREGNHMQRVVATFSRGDAFGEMGFLSAVKRTASIRTRERTKVLVLSPTEYDRLVQSNPMLAIRLLTAMFTSAVHHFQEASEMRSALWAELEHRH